MIKRKVIAIASSVALLGLSGVGFADNYGCPSDISSATSTCLTKAATQQFISNFKNYYSTAQSMSKFNNAMTQQTNTQNTQATTAKAQPSSRQAATPQTNNDTIYNRSYYTPKNTKPYIAPVAPNSNDKKQHKINWF